VSAIYSVNLKSFRWIVVNSSAGKDSQTALTAVVRAADAQGFPRSHIVVSHQCLGKSEWAGTLELARQQAEFYGLRFEVSKYRNKDGAELSFLDAVRNRGRWPSSNTRYCTSDFKRGPGYRVARALYREAQGDILYVKGFRADESPARAKRAPFCINEDLTTKSRTVYDWLPIHSWSSQQVWASIRASGVPYHKAYDLGMPRLSCCFCIFAPKHALLIAGRHNYELLKEYVAVEQEIGHTFKNGSSLADIKAALDRGERGDPKACSGNWNM